MKAVAFKPAGDANGVSVCIPEADALVYVAPGYTTDDPLIVAALDANDAVERAPKGHSTAAPAPDASTEAPADSSDSKENG